MRLDGKVKFGAIIEVSIYLIVGAFFANSLVGEASSLIIDCLLFIYCLLTLQLLHQLI